ncbi:hypothetical protein RF11_14625 [Thelohanellus kitauei]|uniref:Uncharacterized protein n=1 Tax=Thelohanellus kitauei TaxID=669202 RepID=A0A0C2NBP5_THEKT|nr:hypothetical protein RF11_14625 [Thelohanellus kitauei]
MAFWSMVDEVGNAESYRASAWGPAALGPEIHPSIHIPSLCQTDSDSEDERQPPTQDSTLPTEKIPVSKTPVEAISDPKQFGNYGSEADSIISASTSIQDVQDISVVQERNTPDRDGVFHTKEVEKEQVGPKQSCYHRIYLDSMNTESTAREEGPDTSGVSESNPLLRIPKDWGGKVCCRYTMSRKYSFDSILMKATDAFVRELSLLYR